MQPPPGHNPGAPLLPPSSAGVPMAVPPPAGGAALPPGMTLEQYQMQVLQYQQYQQQWYHYQQQHAQYVQQVQAQGGEPEAAAVLPAHPSVSPPPPPPEDAPEEEDEKKLKVICDTSMGLEGKLLQNIQQDYYYTDTLALITTFDDLCKEAIEDDEKEPLYAYAWGGMRSIYRRADNMVLGRKKSERNQHENRSPSKLWCILYRMFEIKITPEQLRALLKDDATCLRCVGVLYVRFTQRIEDSLSWVHGPLVDDSEVLMQSRGHEESVTTTLARFTRNVLTELKYLDTRFPRVPEKKLRDLRAGIAEEEGKQTEGPAKPSGDRGSGRERDYDRRKGKEEDAEKKPERKRRTGRLGELNRRSETKSKASPQPDPRSRAARMRRGSSED